jgi:hypothetical protein
VAEEENEGSDCGRGGGAAAGGEVTIGAEQEQSAGWEPGEAGQDRDQAAGEARIGEWRGRG